MTRHNKPSLPSKDPINSYLANIVIDGIHTWKFKCINLCRWDEIGIRNITGNKLPLTKSLSVGIIDDVDISWGYSFYFKTNGHCTNFGDQCKKDDIITMMIDCRNWKFSIEINDRNIAFLNIRPGKYRAALSFSDFYRVVYNTPHPADVPGSCVSSYKLLSYQRVY